MTDLRFDAVQKRFGRVDVLRGFDLAVADGELLVLLGPSGSGKTTALRVAAGLEAPDAGAVLLGGRDVTRVAPGRRNLAMVFQGYGLFPHLTAADNIGFGLRARGTSGAETARRVGLAAEAVGCTHLLGRRPAELSGGERQRVALARALVREPAAFLLDEPLASLDPVLRTLMRTELRALHDRLGATMLHVTHDQHEALTLADRVAVLDGGMVQQAGPPDEVYRRPANRFVAGFIGSPAMNVYRLSTASEGIRFGPFQLDASPWRHHEGEVDVGVRPEDVSLGVGDHSAPAPGGSDPAAAGNVALVEVAGSDAYVHVTAGSHSVVCRTASEGRPAVGETVAMGVRVERLHRFDGATGRRLG